MKLSLRLVALAALGAAGAALAAGALSIDQGSRQVNGNLNVGGPTVLGTVDAGSVYVRGDMQVSGKFNGAVNLGSSAIAAAVIDAGTALIRGDLQVLGTIPAATITTATITTSTVTTSNVTTGNITTLDAGSGQVNGALQVTGPLRVNGRAAVVGAPLDGGSPANIYTEYGYAAMTTGAVTVTFKNAFSVGPVCNCTHLNTTNSNACVLSAVPSTTSVAMAVTSGGSDLVYYQCSGDR